MNFTQRVHTMTVAECNKILRPNVMGHLSSQM